MTYGGRRLCSSESRLATLWTVQITERKHRDADLALTFSTQLELAPDPSAEKLRQNMGNRLAHDPDQSNPVAKLGVSPKDNIHHVIHKSTPIEPRASNEASISNS
jgi:hypothetical protein